VGDVQFEFVGRCECSISTMARNASVYDASSGQAQCENEGDYRAYNLVVLWGRTAWSSILLRDVEDCRLYAKSDNDES